MNVFNQGTISHAHHHSTNMGVNIWCFESDSNEQAIVPFSVVAS